MEVSDAELYRKLIQTREIQGMRHKHRDMRRMSERRTVRGRRRRSRYC